MRSLLLLVLALPLIFTGCAGTMRISLGDDDAATGDDDDATGDDDAGDDDAGDDDSASEEPGPEPVLGGATRLNAMGDSQAGRKQGCGWADDSGSEGTGLALLLALGFGGARLRRRID